METGIEGPAADARRLLARRIGQARTAAEPQATKELITLCAQLPLALSIVAARATTCPPFPLAALAEELRDVESRWDTLDGGEATANARSVFSWSYRRLPSQVARLFRLLALHPGPDIGVPAAAALAGIRTHLVRPIHDPDSDRRSASRRLLDHYLHSAYGAALHLHPRRGDISLPSAHPTRGTRDLP
ncbi:hypothetical protein E1287_35460 [Actinomadura sp. KC06]|uniref:hypothetical protein n=1 Tax=Actinomadura sp. KC06 TaxID=2530369 RepID=UPI00104B280A|nr:hypothetical protein [Actinomadura sp. KC06]TDD27019.1 hypothetical protein E1287_35460 [Actinomadura sp. KC06]